MFRAKRQPAPFFRMPGSPFNPATGERAPLSPYPVTGTTLATFQVIGDDPTDPNTADLHDDYLVCRGFEATADPHFRFLHDPYTAPETTPISVAKPYSLRGTFPYTRGQVIVAARIHTRLGENQGVAATSTGHPANLDEEIELLTDDNGVAVSWLAIESAPSTTNNHVVLYFETSADRSLSNDYLLGTNLVAMTGTAPSAPLTIYDEDFMFPRALAGGHGIAVYDETNARYQCVFVEQQCLLGRAQINTTGGMSGSVDELVPIDNFQDLGMAPFNLLPATLPTQAINRQRHRGRDNQYVILAWDDVHEQWLIIDVEKQQAIQLFDIRYSANKIQVKQAYAAVESDEDLSALTWTDKITTTTCP